jgi:hypothetical protein
VGELAPLRQALLSFLEVGFSRLAETVP